MQRGDEIAVAESLCNIQVKLRLILQFRQIFLNFDLHTENSVEAYKLFAKIGYITKDCRKKIINLAVALRQREWL